MGIKKFALLLLCGATALFALTACGKGFRSLDEIRKSGELVMLTNATFEPFEYLSGDEVVGADPDLARMIADELGVELRIVDMDFDLLVEALKSGKGDLIAAGMTANPERAEQVDFSSVYVENGLLVIVPAGSDIASGADLAGKRVAVQEATTSDDFATDDVEGAEVLRFKDAIAIGDAVQSGKADAGVLDIKPAEGVVANSGGKLELLPDPVTQEDTSMAVAKGNAELLAVVNKVLDAAVADGTVDALIQKHMDATTLGE
ncbi:MAG: transporter substrate-binding domain-containing protein [Clostridiales Family XIII bacterium]|jgi:polar amino acid transport system substrate-binding protein|nr:transporter substrate-binding domain-containing protein [Clostridiales Family XIII bacterium]